MKTADWYFDFISPYAYLQAARLDELAKHANIRARPVLFAGLLNHHGQLGPAEIAPKRKFVFRQSLWTAKHQGIPMKLPPAHPFKPLPPLRLAIAMSCALVTGAAGGVGSVAIAVLAKLGFTVHAVTGRPQEADYLKGLGAAEIIERQELAGTPKPLAKERWAGAVDSVGSATLANLLTMTRYGGAVAACGLAGGMDLPTSVAPFILRGVCLYGIDSVMCPLERRREAWKRLENDLNGQKLAAITTEIGLAEVIRVAPDILAGKVRGRIVVKIG